MAKVEVERQFDANVVLWGPDGQPKDWDSNEPGGLRRSAPVPGRVERVDQNHVKYFLDLKPGKKQLVNYSVTYKRRKVGPELNTEQKARAAVSLQKSGRPTQHRAPIRITRILKGPDHENHDLRIALAGTLLLARPRPPRPASS